MEEEMTAAVEEQIDAKDVPAAPRVEGFDQDQDPCNARNWSPLRKASTAAIVSGIGFACTMAASIFASGREEIAAEFHTSATVSILGISSFNIGMAFGPVIASPLSETFGRRAIYLIVLPFFAFFVLGVGFSQSLASIVVCRFFAGTFASPSVAIASATIADVFAPSERAIPMILYYTTPWLGSLVGPLVGGFVVQGKGWRWTQWTSLFFAIAFLIPILLVHESYKKILVERRARRLGLEHRTRSGGSVRGQIHMFLRTSLGRPVMMLFTEPIVALLCLYMGFQFGLLYCFIVASPYVFSSVYGFDLGAQGLSFLGFCVGCLISAVFLMAVEKKVYQPKLRRFAETHDPLDFSPENRLYGGMLGSACLPAGLICFAWTARFDIHWIYPIMAQAVVMFGSVTVYIPCGMYMMDTYGALYGASAAGANSLLRYTLAAAFPLFTLQMFKGLGVGRATTVLACCTLALAPIPWAFYRWGPGLRRMSHNRRGD